MATSIAPLAESLAQQILDQVGEGVAAFDADGNLIYANEAIAELNGTTVARMLGVHFSRFNDLPPGMSLNVFWQQIAEVGVLRLERASRQLDGATKQVVLNLSLLLGPDGQVAGHVVCVHDVTERNVLRDELRYAATHDGLTGLLNRAALYDQLDAELARPARGTAVVFLDLDGFKAVNDTLGHGTGDQLLVAVAGRLRTAVRTHDIVARHGGDEFIIVLVDLQTDQDLGPLVGRIEAEFARPFRIGDRLISVRASVGVARRAPGGAATDLVHQADDAAADLVHQADLSMYDAKAAGLSQVVYFPSSGSTGAPVAPSRL